MEVLDFTHITEEERKTLVRAATPCTSCGLREHLAFGIITQGENAGDGVVVCISCDLEFASESDKQKHLDWQSNLD